MTVAMPPPTCVLLAASIALHMMRSGPAAEQTDGKVLCYQSCARVGICVAWLVARRPACHAGTCISLDFTSLRQAGRSAPFFRLSSGTGTSASHSAQAHTRPLG